MFDFIINGMHPISVVEEESFRKLIYGNLKLFATI
jgi:hypothetical protein